MKMQGLGTRKLRCSNLITGCEKKLGITARLELHYTKYSVRTLPLYACHAAIEKFVIHEGQVRKERGLGVRERGDRGLEAPA